MDMREMVDKVKRNESLYGESSLSPYMQGMASRNSRYAGLFSHVLPWYNFVNHEQVCHHFPSSHSTFKLKISSTVLTQQSTTSKLRENWLKSNLKGASLRVQFLWAMILSVWRIFRFVLERFISKNDGISYNRYV